MSLKPIEPRHVDPADQVDPGMSGSIPNQARSMNRYSSQRMRTGSPSPDATGGIGVHAHSAAPALDKRRTAIVVAVAVVVFAAVVVAAVFAMSSLLGPAAEEELPTGTATVTIPTGYGAGDIAQILREEGVITSTTEFIQAVNAAGASSTIKAGTYEFERGSSYESIVAALVEGPSATSGLTLTVPEGLTVAQTAQRVADTLGIAYDDFMAQAKASNYVGEFTFLNGAYNDSLEGYLFPKTYTFEHGVSADTVIRAMLNQYVTETAGIDWTLAAQGNTALTQQQVVTMASLIERETAVAEERPLVASVIFNRLNAGMYLQIDAAINYALGKDGLLTIEDTQVDSPYNTYTNYGLPVGPICSPSLSSIMAVINAEQTSYYYYVASAALDGTHVFCETDAEFAEARDAYNAAAGQ